jgi:hypothetical protein
VAGSRFVDRHGRTVLLRGINIGAGSKIPSRPDGATHKSEGFFDHRTVSFLGRPIPRDAMEEHLERVSGWGFNHVRLLVTWEAVEHAGPGIYDGAYLDELEALVAAAARRGLSVHIDPHQDVWSRFSGGDGAPGWTLEAAGIDLTRVQETGAAILHQLHGDPFPRMIWPTNAAKLAAATMFTLFFAGNRFAPHARIAGETVQDFLQRHYFGALAQVAARLRSCANVLGYETMNEPSHGYIGHRDLGRLEGLNTMGNCPTPYQSMLLASGFPQEVPVYRVGLTGLRVSGTHEVNPAGIQLWADGTECVWRRHGVWGVSSTGAPRLLQPGYFASVGGRAVDFGRDFYRPFASAFARAVRAPHPRTLIFIQTEINHEPPAWETGDAEGVGYAPHWYDSLTLVLKRFHPFLAYDPFRGRMVLGRGAARRSIADQLSRFAAHARDRLSGAPTILGETGVPMDLRNGRPGSGRLSRVRESAVDRVMAGIESALLSSCWWTYAVENDALHGDQWNGEDFSVYSRADGNGTDGGRALGALVRPYPCRTAGEPLALVYRRRRGLFSFTFRHDPALQEPTEVFVPALQYPRGVLVSVSDGSWQMDAARQVLVYRHGDGRQTHTITLRRR